MRIKIACINWTWPRGEAPHFVTYVLRDGEAFAEAYHDTWGEAIARADYLVGALSLPFAVLGMLA